MIMMFISIPRLTPVIPFRILASLIFLTYRIRSIFRYCSETRNISSIVREWNRKSLQLLWMISRETLRKLISVIWLWHYKILMVITGIRIVRLILRRKSTSCLFIWIWRRRMISRLVITKFVTCLMIWMMLYKRYRITKLVNLYWNGVNHRLSHPLVFISEFIIS